MQDLVDRQISFPLKGGASLHIPAEQVATALLEQLFGKEQFAEKPLQGRVAVPAMGAYWPGQGGHYAGTYEYDGKSFALIVSPAELEFKGVAWATQTSSVVGTEHLWDGAANTKALLAAEFECPAAKACAALEVDGHKDFVLPARHQARFAYLNVPQLFDPDPWYWTSTQYAGDSDYAWCQNFSNGNQSYGHKTNELRARAVRTIQL